MEAYATPDGYVYWGLHAIDIVDKMRKGEFSLPAYPTNRIYIQAVARRIRDASSTNARGMARMNEQQFLDRLVELEFLHRVEGQFECPLAQTLCTQIRPECSRPNAVCWLKKQENG